MFCFTFSEEGMVIGVIESIYVKNVYFEKPQTVKNMDSGNLPGGISRYFPTDQWEDYIGSVRVLGAFPYDKESDTNNKNQKSIKISKSAKRASFPVKPGEKIYILDGDRLIDFIGLENNGLNLGKLEHYDIDVKINMSKLINKHFAVWQFRVQKKLFNFGYFRRTVKKTRKCHPWYFINRCSWRV
jgi:hypothetical protein